MRKAVSKNKLRRIYEISVKNIVVGKSQYYTLDMIVFSPTLMKVAYERGGL